jgi:hypothetical protein
LRLLGEPRGEREKHQQAHASSVSWASRLPPVYTFSGLVAETAS